MTQGDDAADDADKRMDRIETNMMAGFEDIQEQFRQVDARFDRMHERFDKMDGRLDKMDGRLDKMDGRLDRMDERFDRMDGRLDRMQTDMIVGFSDLNDRVDQQGDLLRQILRRLPKEGEGSG